MHNVGYQGVIFHTVPEQKAKERQGNGNWNSQSQGSRPRKTHNLLVDQMIDRGGKKYREKTKARYFWFMDFEEDKCYVTQAGDTYNVNNDPPEKCRECGKGRWVWMRDLV